MGAVILFAQLSNKTEKSYLAIKFTITLKQLALDSKHRNHYRSKKKRKLSGPLRFAILMTLPKTVVTVNIWLKVSLRIRL